jgi:methylated-DNA-[protein]-cysteine S-methyltransferase
MNYTTTCDSPIGELRIVVDGRGTLLQIEFPNGRSQPAAAAEPSQKHCAHVVKQLREYFAGKRTRFELRLAPAGTDFQQQAWRQLARIPYGATISYQEQSRRIGKPTAMRAVGAANGRNPIPIVVPCHRVIGKNGSLTGFGGGLPCKRWLLEHEQKHQRR